MHYFKNSPNVKRYLLILWLFCILGCSNHIEPGSHLRKSEVALIQRLHLLDSGEHIYKFYSEYKTKVAGNFFTDKRMACYWLDEKDKSKDRILSAYYPDIVAIDTVYNAGLTYSPYMLVTTKNRTQFRVCADGAHQQIKAFFEAALEQWRLHQPAE
jgi:hypothetical protein